MLMSGVRVMITDTRAGLWWQTGVTHVRVWNFESSDASELEVQNRLDRRSESPALA